MSKKGGNSVKSPYIPAIDGIRGLSVVAVILFHLGYGWMRGGFLGVEVFFVVSGYVITALLAREYAKRKKINRKQFYWRRIRRLMPAVYVLMAAVIIATLLLAREELMQLRRDVTSSVLYITNWYFISSDQAYFSDIGRPSLLLHFWSLAIEEQFYLFWPMFALPLIAWFKNNKRLVVLIIIAGALLSQLLAAIYFDVYGIDRAYYGTDSRLTGLLLGALLALLLPPLKAKKTVFPLRIDKYLQNTFALLALFTVIMFFVLTDYESEFLYKYGFLVLDIIVIALIALVAIPGSIVGKLFSWSLMVWLGTRSYALYLWHWPIFQFLRPGVDVAWNQAVTTAVRLSLTVIAAEISYRAVESIIRWHRNKPKNYTNRLYVALVVVAVSVMVVLTFMLRPSLLSTQWPPKEVNQALIAVQGELGAEGEVSIDTGFNKATEVNIFDWQKKGRITGRVTIIGDSVTLGAGKTLMSKIGKPSTLDASVSRFPEELENILRKLQKKDRLGPTVVISLGTNGILKERHIKEAMSYLGEDRRVVWVTPKGDRPWIKDSNKNLRKLIPKYDNAVLVDWQVYSKNKIKWFTSDGIHVEGIGVEKYTKAVNSGVKGIAIPLE